LAIAIAKASWDHLASPWISMDIHGHPWISMDIHGHPWISMDIHGYPRISMDIHGYPISMDIHEDPNWLFVKFGMPLLIPATKNSQLAGYT